MHKVKLCVIKTSLENQLAAAAKSLQSCLTVRRHRQQPTRLPHPWDSPGKNAGVGCHFLLQCMEVKSESEVAQSCLTLSDPMDCSPPGSSVHGIFQARVLEWGATAFLVAHKFQLPRFNVYNPPQTILMHAEVRKHWRRQKEGVER